MNGVAERISTRAIGVIAGETKLPAILAKSAKEKGYRVVALTLSPDAQTRITPHADAVYPIAPGQLGRSLKILQNENIKEIVFIGKIPKINLLRNLHKLDWMAIKELSKLPNFNDDTIQFAMGDIVESHGIKVLRQTDFLRHLFPEYGVMTNCQPTAGEYADINFGFKIAKEIARLDIGQTVIVKDQMVLAIEAIEGTDEAIKRAVQLAKKSVVVIKVAKPNQDQRFDVPAVGMNTLHSMLSLQNSGEHSSDASKENPRSSGGVLAVEAKETMVVEKEEMIAFANAHAISMVAV